MVSSAELAHIQADLAAAVCDKPCVISQKTSTRDAYGQATEAWATISPPTQMAGLSQPTAGELTNYAYAIEDKAAWTVRFPIGTVVGPQNRLLIEGQTLEVHIVLTPKSYPGLLCVIAAELKP
jgi:hypothetical protein